MKAGSFGLTQLLCFFTMPYNTDLILKDSVTVCDWVMFCKQRFDLFFLTRRDATVAFTFFFHQAHAIS